MSRRLITDFPQFYPYFRAQSFVWNGRSFEGHNNLMKFFDGADGLKTGYTRMSGFNLASSATRQGKRLVAVVMGGRSARDRDIQTAQLLESEFTKLGARPSRARDHGDVAAGARRRRNGGQRTNRKRGKLQTRTRNLCAGSIAARPRYGRFA